MGNAPRALAKECCSTCPSCFVAPCEGTGERQSTGQASLRGRVKHVFAVHADLGVGETGTEDDSSSCSRATDEVTLEPGLLLAAGTLGAEAQLLASAARGLLLQDARPEVLALAPPDGAAQPGGLSRLSSWSLASENLGGLRCMALEQELPLGVMLRPGAPRPVTESRHEEHFDGFVEAGSLDDVEGSRAGGEALARGEDELSRGPSEPPPEPPRAGSRAGGETPVCGEEELSCGPSEPPEVEWPRATPRAGAAPGATEIRG